MSEMDEIIKEFLVESNDNLDQLDRDLVKLEKDPGSRELLGRIFRAIHTVKGTSGVLGYGKLESVAHVGESLLSRMRDGKLRLNAEITTGLLSMVDAVREILRAIEATGTEGEGEYTAVIERLRELLQEKPAAVELPRIGEILVKQAEVPVEAVEAALEQQQAGDPRRIGEILVEKGQVHPQAVLEALKSQTEVGSQVSGSSIRVDVNLLDKLMNLVGELVLARNQILQFTGSEKDSNFLGTAQRLNLITTELQEGVMKTRMQPIGNVWNKFPRVVRDLAVQFEKQVHIEMEGNETELDKTIIEAIKDPLTHIVRNAVDHGIELPAQRTALGKPADGRLALRAFHEGGQVNIEIADDGAGLNLERLKQKAIERGSVSQDQAARMSDREVANLVFLPGLSTAQQVTNVSGRGVGMDVVKTNIEKIGGTVDIHSTAGRGTTIKIKIPLTLAIIPALVATSGRERFAIPQVSLLELVRLEGEQAAAGIEMIHGAPVHRLRGKLLPLVYLNRALRLENVDGSASADAVHAETFEFDVARERHQAWIRRLQDFLGGSVSLSAQEASSATGCALGRWLHGTALGRDSHFTEIGQLEEGHRRFHEMVAEVIRTKESEGIAASSKKLAELAPVSEEMIRLLSVLEKKVKRMCATNIVVLQADDRQFGLVVDEINDTEEIVVKPLGKQFKSISCFAGATIMGDGKVALILDVLGIAQMANVITQLREHNSVEVANRVSDSVTGRDAWLVFAVGDNRRMAIPLSMVSRLEEFAVASLERSGRYLVVQYRGQIMPLVDVAEELGLGRRDAEKKTLQVIVYTEDGKSVGLIVDRIVDIVEQAVVAGAKDDGGETVGSAVIQERVTDLLNVHALVAAHAMRPSSNEARR